MGRRHYNRFHCPRCLHYLSTRDGRDRHANRCRAFTLAKGTAPPFTPQVVMGKTHLQFVKVETTQSQPLIIYADFESAMLPEPCAVCDLPRCHCEMDPSSAFVKPINTHECVGFALVVVDDRGSLIHEAHGVGHDAGLAFVDELLRIETELTDILRSNFPIHGPMPTNDGHCVICKRRFSEDDLKVVHHDHQHRENNIKGYAHNSCNLRVKDNHKRVILSFHNFYGYDVSMLMQAIARHPGAARWRATMKCLARNTEKLRALSFGIFTVVDSIQHLTTSLQTLSDALSQSRVGGPREYPLLWQSSLVAHNHPDRERILRLLLRKLPFPYDLVTGPHALVGLVPSRQHFKSDEDFALAEDVFHRMACKDMNDFLVVYNRVDVLLLAEVFEDYRQRSRQWFNGLDPLHFISLPSLSLAGFLHTTGIQMELLQSQNDYELIEKNIRGGVSYCSVRRGQSTAEDRLLYVDACSLYASVQTLPLPLSGFRWLSPEELEAFDISAIDPLTDGGPGFFILCDLDYPPELALTHSDMPLAVQTILPKWEWLSPYTRSLKPTLSSTLVGTMGLRTHYLTHAANLKLYLGMGMKLRKIHGVFTFYQTSFLKPFIHQNMERRRRAVTTCDSNTAKLLTNALYGKMMQSVRKYMDMKVVTSEAQCRKWTKNKRYKSHKVIHQNLIFIFLTPFKTTLNVPIAVGFTILELSKWHMTSSYYHKFLKVFPRMRLVFSDTDSFFLQTGTGQLEEGLRQLRDEHDLMDFSGLDPHHPLYSVQNKNRPFCFKVETKEDPREVVALRPKVYCVTLADGTEMKKCKGVKGVSLTMQDYRRVLFDNEQRHASFSRFRLQSMTVQTVLVNKLALNAGDTKRFWFPCKIHSAPFHSVEIRVFEGECRTCLGLTEQEQRDKLAAWIQAMKRSSQ